ncbi:hypothetical protein [Myroides sp. DW712]|uniref:hypothetical protein n=1 Tax=Myroides sp. DW712 TaxID=3389800 RepID=UPI0039781DF3
MQNKKILAKHKEHLWRFSLRKRVKIREKGLVKKSNKANPTAKEEKQNSDLEQVS